MKKYGVFILNGLLFLFGVCGILFTLSDAGGFMNGSPFMFYTQQSNILVMVTAVLTILFEARQRRGQAIPTAFSVFRFVSTVAITLTFLVFSLMLIPVLIAEGNGKYLTSAGNLCAHNLVPICAILDYCLFGTVKKFPRGSVFLGLIPAVLYTIFVYVMVPLGVTFSGVTFPYFFFDYMTYGWLSIGNGGIGVVYWLVILVGVLIGVGTLFLAIVRHRERKADTPEKVPSEADISC